jgi:uncharacterized OB-fold protein
MVRGMSTVIPPVPNRDDQFFWDGVAERRLLLQRCADCKALRHPPQPVCAACGSLATEAVEASGRGTVFTWLLTDDRVATVVALEEGVRLVSNLVDVAPDDVRIGMDVELVFVELDGVVLPQFRPVGMA